MGTRGPSKRGFIWGLGKRKKMKKKKKSDGAYHVVGDLDRGQDNISG